MEDISTDSETETLEDIVDPKSQSCSPIHASSASGSEYENRDTDIEPQPSVSTDDKISQASSRSLEDSDSELSAGRITKGKGRRRKDPKADQLYNDGYRKLLNDNIQEVLESPFVEESEMLQASQIGLTNWSPLEKSAFFHNLSRCGKDDIHRLAMQIGTKSEMEVRVYMQFLQTAAVDHQLHDRKHQLLAVSDLPAAAEVSEECVIALGEAAEALRRLQNRREKRVERRKHGELWRLNSETASWVDERLAEGDEAQAEVLRLLPAADLLNLQHFVKLSSYVFMNSTTWEDNWQSIALKHESPSLMYTAFSDFHTLAVSLTKRLMQTSLYFAMSRRRATDKSKTRIKRVVKRRDVVAALQVLGMVTDSKAHWIGIARRCKLDVFESLKRRTRTGQGEKLSYEIVEKTLHGGKASKDRFEAYQTAGMETASEPKASNLSSLYVDEPTSSSSVDSSSEADMEVETLLNDAKVSLNNKGSRARKRQRTEERLEKDQDDYTELLDEQANLYEEERLWQILDREPQTKLNPNKVTIPKRPIVVRKVAQDLEDWRTWLDYKNEWEAFATPLPLEALTMNRKKRQRSNDSSSSVLVQYSFGTSNDGVGKGSFSESHLKEVDIRIHEHETDIRSAQGSSVEESSGDHDAMESEDAEEPSLDSEDPGSTSGNEAYNEEEGQTESVANNETTRTEKSQGQTVNFGDDNLTRTWATDQEPQSSGNDSSDSGFDGY